MHPHTQTCLLLLVGVMTTCSSGGTIGNKGSHMYFENAEDSKKQIVKNGPEGSGQPNSTLQLPVHTSSVSPPMEAKPLLDEDVLIAFELNKLKTTLPPSTNAAATSPITVAVSQQPPSGNSGFLSQLAEIFTSILNESTVRGESTTQQPRQPPRVNITLQQPPVASTEDVAEFHEFIPQIEEVLKSILVKDKPEGLQPPSTPYLPPPQQPRLPASTEEDLKQILPALEEAIGSILKNSEVKVPTTTRWPVLPTVHPTMPTDSKQHFAVVLPQLEDAIRSILEEAVREEVAKAQQHTTQRPLPSQQPSPQTTKDYGFGNFLPELERVLGGILHNEESNHSATFPNTADTTSTMRTPVTATTSEQAFFQSNIIELDSPSSDSEPLFQAVKSTLADVLKYQELKARKSQTGP